MAEIDVRPALLARAAGHCEDTVAVHVDKATTKLANGEGVPAAAMGSLDSAAAATDCLDTWRRACKDASRTVTALSTKLAGTAAAVLNSDQDAADLYRRPDGEAPHLPLDIDWPEA